MLTEVRNVRQIEGEPWRRWFRDGDLELLVWLSGDQKIVGFELCYNRKWEERALTWSAQSGYSHSRVDDGEGRPGKMKASPILVPDGWFDRETIAVRFRQASRQMEGEISEFVLEKILQYPGRK